MRTTHIDGRHVVLTKGMIDGATGQQMYGMFANEMDARSEDADSLALGTIGADRLSLAQCTVAAANSAELND